MQVQNISHQNFTSRINPVPSFTINTKAGKLHFEEPTLEQINKRGFVKRLTLFFCKNFATTSDCPVWQAFAGKEMNNSANFYLKLLTQNFKNTLKEKNNHLTLLIARDSRRKIQGAVLGFPFDTIPACENSLYYIEDIAVGENFRGCGIGKILLNKSLESIKNKFTDVLLTNTRQVENFYKRLGFKNLDSGDNVQKTVLDFLAQDRYDYPRYVNFMTKSLHKDEQGWFLDAFKAIQNLRNESGNNI